MDFLSIMYLLASIQYILVVELENGGGSERLKKYPICSGQYQTTECQIGTVVWMRSLDRCSIELEWNNIF